MQTGKDRTGWASAALLTFLGVSQELVLQDYFKSNEYILPMYRKQIDGFVAAGGDSLIVLSIFGVKQEYLAASFDEMEQNYGTIEQCFSDGLGLNEQQQALIKSRFLND